MLGMMDFDVILGMDYLATHNVTFNYYLNMIKFAPLRELFFLVQSDMSMTLYDLISALGIRRLLMKGCLGYLAIVRDVKFVGFVKQRSHVFMLTNNFA